MKKFVFINNKIIIEKDAKISINERGFLFGDGIFETLRVFNGKIFDFKNHKDRIKTGLKALKFEAKIDDLEKKCYQLLEKNQIKNGILRISITRGIGSNGYLPTNKSKPLIVIKTEPLREITNKKITLGISSITKPSSDSFPIQYKTNNSLPYILNKIEAQEKNLFDLIMLNKDGFISETSSANIFWIKNNQFFTPSLSCDILPGIIRKNLLQDKNLEIQEVKAKISDIEKSDEIFLTNSSWIVLPVNELKIKNKTTQLQIGKSKNILKNFLKD